MTLRDVLETTDSYTLPVATFFVLICILCGLLRFMHGQGRGGESPWCYIYSFLIYSICIPGIFSLTLCLYTVLFAKESLLDQSVVFYFLPTLSMFISLMLLSKGVDFERVPGFDRVLGLMTLLGITFLVLFFLSRLYFIVGFFGNLQALVAIGVFLFLALKWGAQRMFRSPGEEKSSFPKSPL